MFRNKEAEAVFNHYHPYLDDAAKARLVRVDNSAKTEWNPLEIWKGLEECMGTSSRAINALGLLGLGGMYRPLSEKLVLNGIPYPAFACLNIINAVMPSSPDFFVPILTAGSLGLKYLSRGNIKAHEFLHAASHHTFEPEDLTKRMRESGLGFEYPTGLAWRDESTFKLRGSVLNEGLTVKKSFDVATPGFRSKVAKSYIRLNHIMSATYGGGFRLARLANRKISEKLGPDVADRVENKLYFQGNHDDYAEALNISCRKNVYDFFMELADQKKIRQAEQTIKV